ncbi:MAG: hypothetical protein K0U41_06905 [Gammaproteobacteria bacterium]|nr:hypothetical protein [Gammaproteobacteria bacterium]
MTDINIKIRYESFNQFFRINEKNFADVQSARKEMKSSSELGMTGDLFLEAEKLAFKYLNLDNLVSDLLFGVSASLLDAKHDIKNQMALAYRDQSGAQGEKKIMAEADARVTTAVQKFNDLNDLNEYLNNKKKDFEKCYYHYKHIYQGNK